MKHASHRTRKVLTWMWRVATVALIFLNLRLYSSSPLARTNHAVPPMLAAQLAANRNALNSGSPAEMQQLFPEGYYFSYLFHGLTWIELAMRDESFVSRAIEQAMWCLSRLDSPEGRAPFPRDLPPDHGMFYSAWKCSLRAGVVVLQQGTDSNQLGKLREECDAIAEAITASRTPFLPSYNHASWPCDTVPALHALATCDRITGEDRYRELIRTWLASSQERLDPETRLLPHTAELPEGRTVGGARATSQVILLRLLPDIDAIFAQQQYERFRERFLTTFAGAPCVREYPSGISGRGDIDSGPLIFGRSLSATVLMMGVAQVYGDQSLADAIAQAGETVGMPWTSRGQKQYAGGLLPIGDIIVAYAQVARPWFSEREHLPDSEYHVAKYWRWQIHAWSMMAFLPPVLAWYRKSRGLLEGRDQVLS